MRIGNDFLRIPVSSRRPERTSACTEILELMNLTERALTIPEIMLIAGTRVVLGAGIGLLISDRLNKDQRKGAGWALLAVGVLTTIPIGAGVFAKPLVKTT
jgi:hypothetical protein